MATIPISDGDPKNSYTATASQTTFPYTFWSKEASHIAVYVNGTLKTLTTDYTISALEQPTGADVVFGSGLTSGDVVVILYDPDFERTAEYTGTIRLDALNTELTYLLTLLQSNKRQADDSVRLSDSEPVALDTILPAVTGNGGKVIGIKTDLTGLEYQAISSSSTVISSYEDESFNGTGAQTAFTLSFTPVAAGGLLVWVDDVRQRPTVDYTISGTTLTFTSAPASGTDNVVVLNTTAATNAATPADGSVTASKIAAGDTITKDSLDDDLITNYTDTVIVAADEILFSDASDSSNMKKDTVQGIMDLVSADLLGKADTVIVAGDKIVFGDTSDSNNPKTDTVGGIVDVAASELAAKTDTVVVAGDKFTFYDASDSDLPKTDTIQGIIDLAGGTIVQKVTTQNTSTTSGTAQIPLDNTVPTSSEGLLVCTAATFTPTVGTNKIRITAWLNGSSSGTGASLIGTIAIDGTIVRTSPMELTNSSTVSLDTIPLVYEYVPGSTSAIAVTGRVGSINSATIYSNRNTTSALFGGTMAQVITIEEITV